MITNETSILAYQKQKRINKVIIPAKPKSCFGNSTSKRVLMRSTFALSGFTSPSIIIPDIPKRIVKLAILSHTNHIYKKTTLFINLLKV